MRSLLKVLILYLVIVGPVLTLDIYKGWHLPVWPYFLLGTVCGSLAYSWIHATPRRRLSVAVGVHGCSQCGTAPRTDALYCPVCGHYFRHGPLPR
jgi:hypothetical protein